VHSARCSARTVPDPSLSMSEIIFFSSSCRARAMRCYRLRYKGALNACWMVCARGLPESHAVDCMLHGTCSEGTLHVWLEPKSLECDDEFLGIDFPCATQRTSLNASGYTHVTVSELEPVMLPPPCQAIPVCTA
jgi:hypothetical protein